MMLATMLLFLKLFVINSSNASYILPFNASLVFEPGISNSIVACKNTSVFNVTFSSNTFNNTVENCSISGQIINREGAQNNLINDTFNASSISFEARSNIAVGHFFHLIVHNLTGGRSVARFIEILPKQLVLHGPELIAMYVPITVAEKVAESFNYTLPRFGLQLNGSCNYSCYFPVESELIMPNGTINYNPYYYYTPYSGFDQVDSTYFNASKNVVYQPAYLEPSSILFDAILPAGKPVYWNFTIAIYNKSPNEFLFVNVPQSFTNGSVVATYYNVTNGTVSYDAGIQPPGTNYFDAIFNTPYDHENTTSEFYSVGLSYCSDGQAIDKPGYYPFAYNTLHAAYVFWITNKSCNIGVQVGVNNVTINCKGGYVKENDTDFVVTDAKNVTIENCWLYGNGILASNSQLRLYNVSFVANSSDNFAIRLDNSELLMSNVSFSGFSVINANSSSLGISTAIVNRTTTIPTPVPITISQVSNFAFTGFQFNSGVILAIGLAAVGIVAIFASRLLKK